MNKQTQMHNLCFAPHCKPRNKRTYIQTVVQVCFLSHVNHFNKSHLLKQEVPVLSCDFLKHRVLHAADDRKEWLSASSSSGGFCHSVSGHCGGTSDRRWCSAAKFRSATAIKLWSSGEYYPPTTGSRCYGGNHPTPRKKSRPRCKRRR